MNLKTGDRVKVIDGYGRTIVDQAVVTRCAGGGIVFVRECTSDGQGLLYGLPTSSIELIETGKPPISEVVASLRTCFGLDGGR